MQFDPKKDLYGILGVGHAASPDEISQAYKVRTRILHPDRFDRKAQPLQWDEANEMQTDLNVAFQVLRDPHSRDLYDQFKGIRTRRHEDGSSRPRASTPPPQAQKRVVQLNIVPHVECPFSDLPEEAKTNLKIRQKKNDLDQVRINTAPVFGPLIQVLLCPFLFWLVYLGANSSSYNELWWLYLSLSGIGAYAGSSGAGKIRRHLRSDIRPYFYLTPLHLIKTEYDHVSIWPLSDVKEKTYLDHYYNGAYNGRTITFHFKSGLEQIRINSKKQVNEFASKYEKYASAWNSAIKSSNLKYFNDLNDLQSINSKRIENLKFKEVTQKAVFAWAIILTIAVFVVGSFINISHLQRNPLRKQSTANTSQRPAPPSSSYNTAPKRTAASVIPPYPEQVLPLNGSVVRFSSRYPQAPFKVDNSRGDHALIKLVDSLTGEDALTIFVRAGFIAETEVPLGRYEARYASGEVWYGYTHNFGPRTAYSKADRYLDFTENETVYGSQVSGCEITLYKVRHGNLSTSRIDASQF